MGRVSPLALIPGQTGSLPTSAGPVPVIVERAFKAIIDIVALGEPGGRHSPCRAQASRPRAAQEKDIRIGTGAGLKQRFGAALDEITRRRSLRIGLPFNQNRRTVDRRQIGDADEIPLGFGSHINQLSLGLALQALPSLRYRHMADVHMAGVQLTVLLQHNSLRRNVEPNALEAEVRHQALDS